MRNKLLQKDRINGGKKAAKKKPVVLRKDWPTHGIEAAILDAGGAPAYFCALRKDDPGLFAAMVKQFFGNKLVLAGDSNNPLEFKAQLPDDLKELIQKMRGEPDAE